MPTLSVITGASGYTGRYIAKRLLDAGESVRTITGHPDRPSPFGDKVEAHPFNWDRPDELARSLEGADVLYNTYWIRFERGGATFEGAVNNMLTLIAAAEKAGVRRLVHVSITRPREDSPLPYFRGKARIERAIRESSLSWAILRPTVLFGGGQDILINNIAWMLRRMPVFGILGNGSCKIQPLHVDDLAALAVEQGRGGGNITLDAVGPDVFTLAELVRTIRDAVGSKALLLRVPASVGLMVTGILGLLVRDVIMTRDEAVGLMGNLLYSDGPPTCPTSLRKWIEENSDALGRRYLSEVAKHFA